MTTPVTNISRTNLIALDPNLATGQVADPALRKACFDEIYNYFDTFVTAYNLFIGAGGIATANLADLSVTTAKIALLAITAAQIANGTITTTQLATGAVTSTNILDGTILDADINASAAIAWTKLSKSGSSLADLATRLASDLTGTLAAAQLPSHTGEATSSAGSAALTLLNSAVIAKLLTGYTSGAGVVAATDSILAAIQKLNGNAGLLTPITGINWASQINYPADNTWNSVAFGNGMFVAVASSGTGNRVIYSPDGVSWKTATYAVDNNWNNVCFGNGLFVAVSTTGTGNRVMTSPDGVTWTIRTSAADSVWTGVCFGNGLFVAVTNSGTSVMISPDGFNWSLKTIANQAWLGICYGNGKFVAVSYDGTTKHVATSPDAITWTLQTTPIDVPYIQVCYANGLFVAVTQGGTGNRVVTSPDGVTWTHRTSAADVNWGSISYGGGMFVAVAASTLMTSPDGINWTLRTVSAINWAGVCYGNGMFVIVSQSGTGNRIMTSGNVLIDASKITTNPNLTLKDYSEALTAYTGVTTTKTLDVSLGNVFDLTLTGAVTLTFSNPAPTGQACTMTMLVRQDSVARVITFPASVLWPSGTVPVITTVSKTYVYTFKTVNGGTTWYGRMDGPY